MKNIIKIFTIAATILSIGTGCKEQIDLYSADNYLYFTRDSTIYTFVDKHRDVVQDTIDLRVALIGNVTPYDRQIDLRIDSVEEAIDGVDFKVVQPLSLLADSSFATIQVVLYRSEDLLKNRKSVYFSLIDSKDLKLSTYNLSRDNGKYKSWRIRFSDKLEKPSWWNPAFFGVYSDARMRFYIDVFGSTAFYTELGYSLNQTIFKLRSATNLYNRTHATPLAEADGKTLITWAVDQAWFDY